MEDFLASLQAAGTAMRLEAPDITRIGALPTKPSSPIDTFTPKYARTDWSLRPVQVAALQAARDANGLLGFIRTAGGKTLISLLLPDVVGSKTCVLLVPPSLKTKLIQSDYPTLSKHWHLPSLAGHYIYPNRPTLHAISYAELSSSKKADILDRISPDSIILDEAHFLTSPGFSSRKSRFISYFKHRMGTRLYAMSGTLIKKSILDVYQLAKLCLAEQSPYPDAYRTREAWAAVLDPEDTRRKDVEQWRIQAAEKEILSLAPGETSPRRAFAKRLFTCPGVVLSEGTRECAARFEFHERKVKTPPEVFDALRKLEQQWEVGDKQLVESVEVARAARQLASGMYTRWVYSRGEPRTLIEEWQRARGTYARELRDYLHHRAKPGIDSMLLTENALATHVPGGPLNNEGPLRAAYTAWASLRDRVVPEDDVVWVSDFQVKDAVAWGQESPGIIWFRHKAMGPAIAKAGRFPLYAGAEDAAGLLAEDGSRTIVLSGNAFSEGHNLQMFSRQLFTTSSSNHAKWEQQLARTHRQGQKADVIESYVYRHTSGCRRAWDSAMQGARFSQEIERKDPLLLLSDVTWVNKEVPIQGTITPNKETK